MLLIDKFSIKLLAIAVLFATFMSCGRSEYGEGTKIPIGHTHQYEHSHSDGTVHTHSDGTQHIHETATPGSSKIDKVVNTIDEERVIWQKPKQIIQRLGDLENKVVADIGAGSGYFSFQLLPQAKKVIAIDIDPQAISFMDSVKQFLPQEFRSKFEARQVGPNSPELKDGEADVAIIVNTIAYIENKIEYLKVLKKGISKNGKLLIIDFKKRNIPIGPSAENKLALSALEQQLIQAGYKHVIADDQSLDYQYIVMATNVD